jgi:hypothetical protein
MTESGSSQGKALRLLKCIYDQTRSQNGPVFATELAPSIGLTEEESQAAWRYLKGKGLIETFSIPFAARISGPGVDAIENAQRQPDHSTPNFPAVTYNIVNNTLNVGTATNSPIQQGSANSVQTTTYSDQERSELARLVNELAAHLDELQLDPRQRQRAITQVATLQA